MAAFNRIVLNKSLSGEFGPVKFVKFLVASEQNRFHSFKKASGL